MHTRASSLVLLTMFFALGAAAQQGPGDARSKSTQQTAVKEQLCNSEAQRMRWEAEQTWSVPALPESVSTPEHRIHLEGAQPQLTIPRLQREWLTPSPEASEQQSYLPDNELNPASSLLDSKKAKK
jgi:hypothetical protein